MEQLTNTQILFNVAKWFRVHSEQQFRNDTARTLEKIADEHDKLLAKVEILTDLRDRAERLRIEAYAENARLRGKNKALATENEVLNAESKMVGEAAIYAHLLSLSERVDALEA